MNIVFLKNCLWKQWPLLEIKTVHSLWMVSSNDFIKFSCILNLSCCLKWLSILALFRELATRRPFYKQLVKDHVKISFEFQVHPVGKGWVQHVWMWAWAHLVRAWAKPIHLCVFPENCQKTYALERKKHLLESGHRVRVGGGRKRVRLSVKFWNVWSKAVKETVRTHACDIFRLNQGKRVPPDRERRNPGSHTSKKCQPLWLCPISLLPSCTHVLVHSQWGLEFLLRGRPSCIPFVYISQFNSVPHMGILCFKGTHLGVPVWLSG